MTELDQLISDAYESQGKLENVNKVYIALLRNQLYLPVNKDYTPTDEEPFSPLFAKVDEKYFLLAFDEFERFENWAGDQMSLITYVELTGKELIKGMSEDVFFILNLGTQFGKEFSPEEILQLKKVVARIDQLKAPG